jgi:hypothetical protein
MVGISNYNGFVIFLSNKELYKPESINNVSNPKHRSIKTDGNCHGSSGFVIRPELLMMIVSRSTASPLVSHTIRAQLALLALLGRRNSVPGNYCRCQNPEAAIIESYPNHRS